jgi:endonuclease/exonuclease/phosphatase family metal-dependent hydrolase
VPPAGRQLAREFAAMIAGWEWDVALLQEVPPWWPPTLARAAGADHRIALTSRNAVLRLRRALAERRPDLIKSNGGGCNAILARREVAEHRVLRLRSWPERRVAQLVTLRDGTCVANYHGSSRAELAQAELEQLCACSLVWASGAPLILGGDLNLRSPLPVGNDFVRLGSRDVDHVLAHGAEPAGDAELLDRALTFGGERVELSDHVPLLARASLPH